KDETDQASTNLANEKPASEDASPEEKQQQAKKIEDLQGKLKTAQERENAARLSALIAEIGQAGQTAAVGSAQAGGGIAHTASRDIADAMHAIQRDYLDHANLDTGPLVATCISSLTGPQKGNAQEFNAACLVGMNALLTQVIGEKN